MNLYRERARMEPKPHAIEARASEWVAREDAGLNPLERHELEQWIASDHRHHGAYVRARAAWLDTERLASLAAGNSPPGRALAAVGSDERRVPVLLAASLAAVLVLGGLFWRIHGPQGRTYVSEIGEVRQIALSDGSQLTLNTDTEATVRYQSSQREVALERGEALFKVAHDTSRPFIVRANDILVKAIGTAFTVRVANARTDIVVTEGTVEVSGPLVSGSRAVERVSANHRVVLATGTSRPDIESVTSEALNRELAWRDGMAAFAGEPMSVAAAEINRHSRERIIIDDAALATRPVVGVFHANDAEAFATAAATTFGAQVVHIDGAIHLRAKDIQ